MNTSLEQAKASLASSATPAALKILSRLAADTPVNGIVLKWLARATAAVEDTPGQPATEAWFKRTIACAPDDIGARISLGEFYRGHGKFDDAIATFRGILNRQPGHFRSVLEIGHTYRHAGAFTTALDHYAQAVAMGADDADIWSAIGDMRLLLNTPEDALEAYQNALDRDPHWIYGLQGIGEALARLDRRAEAAHYFGVVFTEAEPLPRLQPRAQKQAAARAQGIKPLLFIAMQKSASEFIRDTLITLLDLPELTVSIGMVPRDVVIEPALQCFIKGGAIARSHMDAAPDNCAAIARSGIPKVLIHIRDPRQVALSWTHMIARLDDFSFLYSRQLYHPAIPLAFRQWPLQEQLVWVLETYFPVQVAWVADWCAEYDRTRDSGRYSLTTYEAFHKDPKKFFADLATFFEIDLDNAKLDRMLAKAPTTRNYRTGRTDEWHEVFSPVQQQSARNLIPEALRQRFGWP